MPLRLSLDKLPPLNDRAAILAFAMSFNGYVELGPHESASAARAKRRASLTDLRNELFFAARASVRRCNEEYVIRYRELLPYFQRFLAQF